MKGAFTKRAGQHQSLTALPHQSAPKTIKIIKMFSLTQSASFASTKVSAAAKNNPKRSPSRCKPRRSTGIFIRGLPLRRGLVLRVLVRRRRRRGDEEVKVHASKRTPASAKYPTAKNRRSRTNRARTVVPARSVATSASRRSRAAPAEAVTPENNADDSESKCY